MKKNNESNLKEYIILFIFAFIGILSLYVLNVSFFLIFLLSGFYLKYIEIIKKSIDDIESFDFKLSKSVLSLLIISFGTLAALSFTKPLQDIYKYNIMKSFLIGFYVMYFILFLKSKPMKRMILTFNRSWIWFLIGMLIGYGFLRFNVSSINYPLSTYLAFFGLLIGINFFYPVSFNPNTLLQFSNVLNHVVFSYNTPNVILFSLYLFLMLATVIVLGDFTYLLLKRKSHYLEAFFVGISFFTISYLLSFIIYFNTLEFAMFLMGIVFALVIQHFYLILVNEKM